MEKSSIPTREEREELRECLKYGAAFTGPLALKLLDTIDTLEQQVQARRTVQESSVATLLKQIAALEQRLAAAEADTARLRKLNIEMYIELHGSGYCKKLRATARKEGKP